MAKFPVQVVIIKKYGNQLGFVLDKGMYKKEEVKTADGVIITNYFIFKKEKIGGKKLKIPAPEIKHYQETYDKTGKTERRIIFLNLDRDTYYPVIDVEGKLIVSIPQPIYEIEYEIEQAFEKNEAGETVPIKDEAGNYKFFYKTNEKGEKLWHLKLDSNNKPIQAKDEKGNLKFNYIQKPIFDSEIAIDGNKIISLPSLITHRTYDKEHFLADAIETAERIFRSKSFWEKYGSIIAMAVAGFLMAMMLAVAMSNYGTMTDKFVQGSNTMANALSNTAAACRQAVGAAGTTPPF
jgi:hypothetical protein